MYPTTFDFRVNSPATSNSGALTNNCHPIFHDIFKFIESQ